MMSCYIIVFNNSLKTTMNFCVIMNEEAFLKVYFIVTSNPNYCPQTLRVLCGPEPKADAMATPPLSGPGQDLIDPLSPPGGGDSGVHVTWGGVCWGGG